MNAYRTRKAVVLVVLVLFEALCHPSVLAVEETGNGSDSVKGDENFILVKIDSEEITSLSNLTDGVYAIRLLTTAACETYNNGPCISPDLVHFMNLTLCILCIPCNLREFFVVEYLGFNNRTCSTSLSARKTAGPVMRGGSTSNMWRQWMVQVASTSVEESNIYLKAFLDPEVEGDAKCLGFVSTFYGTPGYPNTCSTSPWGNGIFLNATFDNTIASSQLLTVRPSEDEKGSFEIVAANKPDSCSRLLAVEECAYQPVLIEPLLKYIPEPLKYVSWKFIKEYELQPSPQPTAQSPPPPPASPSMSPPPATLSPLPLEIPGPVISAPCSTTGGFVNILVSKLGGNSQCLVTSIEITSLSNSIGYTPQTVEVSAFMPGIDSVGVPVTLDGGGYHSIWAVGKCDGTGNVTERSNQVSVFVSQPVPSPPKGPAFYLAPNGVTVMCPDAQVGESGYINEIQYTKRSESEIRSLVSSNPPALTTTCTSGITDMSRMFAGDSISSPQSFNGDISTWDTSSVSYMRSMFRYATSFDQTIAKWNTSKVKAMDSMFRYAKSFNQPIAEWDTSNVEDMNSMFTNATSFNQPIGSWDTKNVVDVHGMFTNATSFNQPIGGWDTSKVEDMDSMFKGASAFNQPLDNWNTARVMDMDSMFENAVVFNQSLTIWNVSIVSSCFKFAEGATSWLPDTLRPSLTCLQCFPADALVYTQDRGPIQMQYVRIGDRLLTYSDSGQAMYDDVYMIGHKDTESFALFVSITTNDNQTIRLTSDHYIFVVRDHKMNEIPSRDVEVGDGLVVDQAKVVSVMAISQVRSRGLFNPYTRTGRIVVDGILASCHSSSMLDGIFHKFGIPLPTGYQIAFAPIRLLYNILGPRMILRLEWIIDAAADMCNSGSHLDLIQLGQNMVVTSMYCIVTASSLHALRS